MNQILSSTSGYRRRCAGNPDPGQPPRVDTQLPQASKHPSSPVKRGKRGRTIAIAGIGAIPALPQALPGSRLTGTAS